MKLPAVQVPVCSSCGQVARRCWGRELLFAAAAALVVPTSIWVTYALWPWAPLVVGSAVGVGVALGAVALAVFVGGSLSRGRGGFQGVGVQWNTAGVGEAWLEVTTAELAERLSRESGEPAQARRMAEITGQYARIAAALAVLLGFPGVWLAAHPAVRIVNVTDWPLELVADDWALGVVAPMVGEVAGGGTDMRIPAGWRRLSARRLDGRVVDETAARVGLGAVQVYVPGGEGVSFSAGATGVWEGDGARRERDVGSGRS